MIKTKEQQNIPNGWKETKLSELLVEVNERNREQAELPVLSVTNSRGFVLQSEQFARNVHSKNTSNYKIVIKEQFAYNPARINVGSIALLRKWEKGLLSPMYVVFGTKDGLLNDYLQYYIQSPRFSVQVSNNTAGSVRKSLNFNAFEHFDYLYPESKQEQKKIVEVLASVDDDIKKTKEVIKATGKLKRGLMQKLFTQGIGHTKFKQTELGEIPESWEVLKVQDLLDQGVLLSNQDGNHGGSHPKASEYVSEGIPFLSAADIRGGGIDIVGCHFLTKVRTDKLRIGFAKENDVLITHKGTVGEVAVVGKSEYPYLMLTPQVTYYRVNIDKIRSHYLAQYFRSYDFQKRFKSAAKQSTRDFLSITNQRQMLIAFTKDLKEQDKISEILLAVDEKISVNKKLLAKQTELKKGLMRDLLSGVKRVNV